MNGPLIVHTRLMNLQVAHLYIIFRWAHFNVKLQFLYQFILGSLRIYSACIQEI